MVEQEAPPPLRAHPQLQAQLQKFTVSADKVTALRGAGTHLPALPLVSLKATIKKYIKNNISG